MEEYKQEGQGGEPVEVGGEQEGLHECNQQEADRVENSSPHWSFIVLDKYVRWNIVSFCFFKPSQSE